MLFCEISVRVVAFFNYMSNSGMNLYPGMKGEGVRSVQRWVLTGWGVQFLSQHPKVLRKELHLGYSTYVTNFTPLDQNNPTGLIWVCLLCTSSPILGCGQKPRCMCASEHSPAQAIGSRNSPNTPYHALQPSIALGGWFPHQFNPEVMFKGYPEEGRTAASHSAWVALFHWKMWPILKTEKSALFSDLHLHS